MARWQEGGLDIYLPNPVPAQHGLVPRNHGDKAGWATNLTLAGDMLLLAKSQKEVRRRHRDRTSGCEQRELYLRDGKLCLWSNLLGDAVRLGGRAVIPQASMPFLGCMVSGDRLGPVRHRSAGLE